MPDTSPLIPNFAMLRHIGRGSYGEVWLARSVTGVYRAVKVVARARFDEDRPYEREFRGIQKFEPVSVGQETQVSLLHVGRNDAAGFFYYVMELADDAETGEEIDPDHYVPKTLKELRTRRRRLPPEECLSIGLALTRALAHLHAHGLVHRDIKPSNVIFVHGVPKLADIGLVSAVDTSHSFVGTEGFVPPEGPGTVAADVYSLGKVLYEISTGRDRNEFPKLPDDLDSLSERRALLELNEVVLRACDADLSRRYVSADAVRQDLLLLQAGKSVQRLRLIEGRFRLAAKYGVAATIVTALATAAFLWASTQAKRATESYQRAEVQRARAERAEAVALTQLHEANLNWVRANRLTGRPGQRFASLAELARAAARTNRLDLRNEAIACLALPDLRPIKQWAKTPYWDSFNFNASFRLYGTNDDQGNVIVRDTETDAVRFKLPSQGSPLAMAVASPDEHFLATSDMAGRAWIWDLHTCVPRPIEFPREARLLEFTPDSRALVVKHPDDSLHFLNPAAAAEEKSFPGPARLSGIRFNRTGEMFFARAGGQAMVYRTADGQRVRTLSTPASVISAAWHPDGRRIALSWQHKSGLWEAETGRQLAVLEGNEGVVVGLAFNDTGEWLASASWDHATRLWHTDTSREALRVSGAGNDLRISADGRQLAYVSWDHAQVHLFELADTRAVQRFTIPSPLRYTDFFTAQAVFSHGGELVAALDREGLYLFQPPHPAPLAFLPGTIAGSVEFPSSGRAMLTCAPDGIKRWPMEWSADRTELRVGPPEVLAPTRGHRIDAFETSRDGRWLVAVTKKAFLAFDPEKNGDAVRAGPAIEPGQMPHLNPDGRIVASIAASQRARLQIWNPRTGTLLTNLPVFAVRDLAFSPDGRWLACAVDDATTLWRTSDWTERHRIPRPPEAPGRYHVAFSPDGRVVAVSVSDQATRLTLVETGEELGTLPADRMVNSLAYNSDGDRLVAACEPGYFQVWDLRRVRAELATLNLDWNQPTFPAKTTVADMNVRPIRVTIVPEAPSQPEENLDGHK